MPDSETDNSTPDENTQKRKGIWKLCKLKTIKRIICTLIPFALSPLAFSSSKEARCGFVVLWMALFWMLEPVHISVTALLPVPLMPLLGILSTDKVAQNYMKEVLMLLIGGLGVAIALEHCNLHERIALKVLLLMGARTMWLMLGIMSTTAFLSMWISNTATTAMMVPIIDAIIYEIGDECKEGHQYAGLQKVLLLSVAYSANCGGTGTLTGTSPNMILRGYIEDWYPGSSEITYSSWLFYNVPVLAVCVLGAWLILQFFFAPCWHAANPEAESRVKNAIQGKYQQLGQMRFEESAILSLFVLLVIIWFFRDPKFMTGWVELLGWPEEIQITTAVPAVAILILLFLLPAEPWKLWESRPLLTWPVMQERFPWGILILLGGGFALADGTEASKLSKWMSNQLKVLFTLSASLVLVIMCVITTLLTEVMSNTAITTIMLPIVNDMAKSNQLNPLYFLIPVTVVASYAFMLPVATGPNAIVYGTGHIKLIDMLIPGFVMNVFAVSVQLLAIHTYGDFLYSVTTKPSWVNSTTADGDGSEKCFEDCNATCIEECSGGVKS